MEPAVGDDSDEDSDVGNESPDTDDAIFMWGKNKKTYIFAGNQYWR